MSTNENIREIEKLLAISNEQEFTLSSQESPLINLDNDSYKNEYDFTKPINIFQIDDKEVKKLVKNFFQGVESLFGHGGKRPIDGVNDYGNYTYNSIVLNTSTQDTVAIKNKTDDMQIIPRVFDEMRTTGEKLHDAGIEMSTTIANYMASKYNTRVAISFDNLYFGESYFYLSSDISGKFNKEEYSMHIDNIHRESHISGLGDLPEPSVIISDANNLIDVSMRDIYSNGKEEYYDARLDILTGEITDYKPIGEKEEDVLNLKTQKIIYDGRIEANVYGDEGMLIATSIGIFADIIEKREELLIERRDSFHSHTDKKVQAPHTSKVKM